MALNITRGKVAKAQKVVVYGPEGVGKTTFAAQFPDPLFIDTEGSTEHYDVARTEAPKSWSALLDQVREVKRTRPCSTLVIDTADWAERMCMEHVCAQNKWESIETPGYGRGYNQAVEEFCRLLDALSDVAGTGVNVVLTAHAAIRKFEQPDEAASYDRWELKLINGNKASDSAKVKEWADALLFANYKTIVEVVGDGKGAHGKARNGQRRVLCCQHHACWDAKNRWGLGEEVPLEYARIAPFVPASPATAAPAQAPVPVPPAEPAPMPAAPAAPKPVQSITFAQDGTVVSDTSKTAGSGLPGFWAPALQLMEKDGVSVDEVRAMSAAKGFFSADTPAENYPEDYVRGGIVAQWPKCLENIKAMREEAEPVPFGAPDMTKA